VATVPTIGFNCERCVYKSIEVSCSYLRAPSQALAALRPSLTGTPVPQQFVIWDIGGQDKLRKLWRHYYQGKVPRIT
jgi:GTPase SAR1 family protein